MASGHTRGQKPSPFGLTTICFGSGTDTEHKKPLLKALPTLVIFYLLFIFIMYNILILFI